jgi:hypothetical protein
VDSFEQIARQGGRAVADRRDLLFDGGRSGDAARHRIVIFGSSPLKPERITASFNGE